MSCETKALLIFSEIESRRFGFKVYRGSIEDINSSELEDFILQNGVDVAIMRIPIEKNLCIEKLKSTGLPYFVADVLVYYQLELKNYHPNDLKNKDLEFVEARLEHREIMDRMVAETFVGYKNHYSSNFLFNIDIIEAYKEWTQNYYLKKEEGKCTWLVKRGERYIGFVTCAYSGDVSELILGGIIPQESGGGVYTDMIRFSQQFFKNKGYPIYRISTQLNNYAVQKVWSREGLFIKQSFLTIHMNSLISASCVQKKTLDMIVTDADVLEFAKLSSDVNPAHIDAGTANIKEFKGEIAHGLVANAIISKFFSTEFPGFGTIIIGSSNRFFKPMYLNCPYRFEITFPYINYETAFYKSVVKVINAEREICILSYYDLAKK